VSGVLPADALRRGTCRWGKPSAPTLDHWLGVPEELQGYSEPLFTVLILNGYFVQKSDALGSAFSVTGIMLSNHTAPPSTVNPCQLPQTSFSVACRMTHRTAPSKISSKVSQQSSFTGDMYRFVMSSGQQRVCNHSRDCMTVVCLKC
jgi:hypothetical protein